MREANLRSIQFLRDVAADYAADIPQALFSGYVGPRGDAYSLNRRTTVEESEEYHSVQVKTRKEAAVDLAWAVMFNNPAEAIGVVQAARRIGLPVAESFSLDALHRLSSGVPVAGGIAIVDEATDCCPAFFSLNCSHPFEFEPALDGGAWTRRIRPIRPNAAKMDKIALCKLGHLEEGDPEELGCLMADIGRRYPHMDTWGGCCGTGHVHLEEIARRLPQSVTA